MKKNIILQITYMLSNMIPNDMLGGENYTETEINRFYDAKHELENEFNRRIK